jgi:DNA-binding NtrC family response regulator
LLWASHIERLAHLHPLRGATLRVGRDPASEIRIDHETVSRNHAELILTEEGFYVRDLGSRNGTVVNGKRLRETSALVDGSVVRFGDVLYQFVESGVELHAAYLPDGRMSQSAARLGPPDSALLGGLRVDRIAAKLERAAPSALSVLLLGESGTGKEVAAHELHRVSRRSGRFCATNCAAIPANLLESELFGYKKGAFSGAVRDKPGLFQAADGGTLLLDEIGDMPAESQAKLLRVLQSGEITPLGAVEPSRVSVRIVAATHQDLEQRKASGQFRGDLYARLSEVVVRLPPLRERKEDIVALALAFARKHGAQRLDFSVAFVSSILHYDWPYNVRELESCIKHCITLGGDDAFSRQHLPDAVRDATASYGELAPEEPLLRRPSRNPPPPQVSEDQLRTLLAQHRGNISAVARALGKARMQVHRWLSAYDLDAEAYRDVESSDDT